MHRQYSVNDLLQALTATVTTLRLLTLTTGGKIVTKAIRMTVTSTVEITSPLDTHEQHLTSLTDRDRDKIRRDMKRQMTEQAKQSGSKIKSVVVSRITLVEK